ncbi:MAG: hypothetical protein KF696_11770 [Planctomycetes bacterium]|nr:hypothetical protein [Planctomycetota bacterium]MCW8136966.1 hypothetical protein [Planctomycetota bacterium]
MAYLFLDAPADSADLDTYTGYVVAKAPTVARGGPVSRAGDEMVLKLPPAGSLTWFKAAPPAYTLQRGIKVPVRAVTQGSIAPTAWLASWVWVPALCGALVWLIGMMGA